MGKKKMHGKQPDYELERRIEQCRADYEAVTAKPCQHFFCPILWRDEPAEICRGHMVALGTGSIWVPQRKDVDHFYGSVVEADLATIAEDRGKDPWELLLDPNRRPKHNFRLEVAGETVQLYMPRPEHLPVPGHTRIEVRNNDDQTICNIGIKVSPEKFREAMDGGVQLTVERDFRPSVIASILKAAHLTMVRMLGYEHVFSSGGIYVSHILRTFYERSNGSHGVREEEVARHFLPHSNMIAPLVVKKEGLLPGTAEDNMLLSCVGMTDHIFAIGVIVGVTVKDRRLRFCVFLPSDCGKSINTYFSFLKEPNKFLTARLMNFCDDSDGKGERWEVSTKTMEIPLSQEMPD
jgi:hypothetical protein